MTVRTGLGGLLRLLHVWGPVAALMAVIAALSHSSDLPVTVGPVFDGPAHAVVYGVLGALLVRAFAGADRSRITLSGVVLAVVVVACYGLLDEVHQSWVPDRSPDPGDLAADVVGAAVGAVFLWRLGRARRRLRARRLE